MLGYINEIDLTLLSHLKYTSVHPQAPGHMPDRADMAWKGVFCYLPKTQHNLQMILVINILLAAIKSLRACD